MSLEGYNLLKIQKWLDAILSYFWKYLSTNKSCPAYKYIKTEHQNISYFLITLDTRPKFATAKENYESF